MIRTFVPILAVLVLLSGCSKNDGVQTVLDTAPGFGLGVPGGFLVDQSLNPNDSSTTTWFREDGLAILAVDVQPLAGKRLKALQVGGAKRYLAGLAKDVKRDLGNQLKEFSHIQKKSMKLGKKEAVLVTFRTRHKGANYKVYLLLTVQLGDKPHEIMVDFRIPLDEVEQDRVWSELMKSWHWGEAKKAEGEH